MIPTVVALIADAHDPESLSIVESFLIDLKKPGVPMLAFAGFVEEAMEEVLGTLGWLSPFPQRRLVPEVPKPSAVSELLSIIEPELLVPGLTSPPDGLSVLVGLFLIHDYLQEAHALAQSADREGPNQTAPYWHGIMHRREPDYDNARYWFRHVGQHAIFPAIGQEVAKLMEKQNFAAQLRFDRVLDRGGHWDPMAFIDLCEECGTRWDGRAQTAAQLQSIEFRVLLEYTCRAARGEI